MLLHILYLVGITAEAMTGPPPQLAEGQCAIFCWATIRSAGSNTRNM